MRLVTQRPYGSTRAVELVAEDLARWIDDPEIVVGRTHDHPVRNATVDEVGDQQVSADDLCEGMATSFAEMASVIERLTDEHLDVPMNNVKYGSESIAAYFARYVTGHKMAHVDQLRRTIVRVRGLRG